MCCNFLLTRTMLFLLILFTWSTTLLAQGDSLNSDITLHTYVESDNVPLNSEVVYHIELSWPGELDEYDIGDISDPSVTNLALRGSGSSNRQTTDDSGNPKAIKIVTYYFKPLEIGMAYVDGITIQYTQKASNKSETLFARRLGVKISEPTEEPKKEFIPGTIVLWAILIGFLIIVAYFIFRYVQRRNKNQDQQEKTVSLEEKYLDLLNQTIHLSNDASKENIASMRKLLTSYIAEKFSIPGNIEKNIVMERLEKSGIAKDYQAKIEQMYAKAELAQFAGEEIEVTELHIFYDTIEYILQKLNTQQTSNSGNKE